MPHKGFRRARSARVAAQDGWRGYVTILVTRLLDHRVIGRLHGRIVRIVLHLLKGLSNVARLLFIELVVAADGSSA